MNQQFNFLPFLDFSINWNQLDAFTRVYRKETTSRVVMPFTDFGPKDWKIGTLIGFIRRAITHTSPTHMKLVDQELNFIKSQFAYSGYPHYLISEKINCTMTKMLYAHTLPPPIQKAEKESQRYLPLFLPWCGDTQHHIIKQLRFCIPNDFARISIAYSTTKLRCLLPSFSTSSNHSQNRFLFNNLVYKYTCNCGQVYIGETERRLQIRIDEHANKKDSAIYEHTQTCSSAAAVERDKFTIVAKRLRHRDARKRFESIYIRYLDKKAHTTMNNCKSSRELVIF